MKVHNAGRGAKYTRQHAPVKLVYIEAVENLSAALKRERAIKSLDRRHKKKLVEEYLSSFTKQEKIEK